MDLQAIQNWLVTFPLWKPEVPLYIDYTDAQTLCGGLFPLGVEEVSRTIDVLGNTTISCRARFELRMVLPGPDGADACAQWLFSLQQWVQEQSQAGLAPVFGDAPKAEQMRAEKARLTQIRKPGKGMYTVCFTAEYKKLYEVIE